MQLHAHRLLIPEFYSLIANPHSHLYVNDLCSILHVEGDKTLVGYFMKILLIRLEVL